MKTRRNSPKGWALVTILLAASATTFGQSAGPAKSLRTVNTNPAAATSGSGNTPSSEAISPELPPPGTSCFNAPSMLSPNVPGSAVPVVPTGTNLAPAAVPGPVSYIRSYTALQPNLSDPKTIATQPSNFIQTQTRYVDGLGQPIQTVVKEGAPNRQDLVQPYQYDNQGRELRTFLPFTSDPLLGIDKNGSRFYNNALRQQGQYYLNAAAMPHSDFPYTERTYEASPLNRMLTEAAPGEAWVGANRKVSIATRPNVLTDNVRMYAIAAGLDNTITYLGFYAAGQIVVSETRNEHGKRMLEYKDREGKIVATKVEADNGSFLHTCHIYDDLGNLRVVIPPKAMSLLGSSGYTTFVEPYLFRYNYDTKQRLIVKKVPGSGEVHLVYDKLNRLILRQDAKQRTKSKWAFTKYDRFNRPVLTGLVTNTNSRSAFQTLANQATTLSEDRTSGGIHNYTNNAIPTITGNHVLTATYYDDYDFDRNQSADVVYDSDFDVKFSSPATAPVPFYQVKGQVTATKIIVPLTATFYWTYHFYDDKSNLIQTIQQNRQGTDRTTTAYTFTGKPLQTVLKHTNNLEATNTYTIQRYYEYDHAERLKSIGVMLNDGYYTSFRTDYNPLGDKISSKSLGNMQDIKYDYNIRGWLTGINNPDKVDNATLFGMTLHYENGFTNARYDGNITGMTWRNFHDNIYRSYGFQYDGAQRLQQADYRYKATQTAAWDRVAEDYSVWGLSYDENGNIQTLNRRGQVSAMDKNIGEIDALGYRYSGNRLTGVDDKIQAKTSTVSFYDNGQSYCSSGMDEYTYDENGNMLSDKNKGITNITYNHQNLPELIEFGTNKIRYIYDGEGNKVGKEVTGTQPAKTYDYIGNAIFENNLISLIQLEEGRAVFNQETKIWEFEYDYKDHLGNTRLTFKREWVESARLSSEQSNAELEEATFERVAQSRHLDNQRARSGDYAVWLNSEKKRTIGPGKVLKVQKGDSVSVNVYGHFEGKPKGNFFMDLASVLGTSLVPPQAGEFTKGKPVYPHLSLGMTLAPAVIARDNKTPKAYLRYVVLDKDSNYVSDGAFLLDERAKDNWQELKLNYAAQQDGYVEIYLANESSTDAWFDDLRIGQYITAIKQVNHYDPWGLNLNDIELKGNPENKFQYNGKEKQDEYGLNWNDFGARFYDSQLGRWHVVDPLADDRNWVSPYNYVQNNPMMRVDPNGMLDGDYYDMDGNYLGNDGKDDDKVYTVAGTSKFNIKDFQEGGKYSEDKDAFYQNNGEGYSVNYNGTTSEAFKTWDSVTNKRIGTLHPAIRMKTAKFINQVEDEIGTKLRISDVTRTIKEQNDIYSQGRTKPGNIASYVKGGSSYHNFGLAIDIAGINGRKTDYNLDFEKISSIGKKLGFFWGGDWIDFKDRTHFQMSFGKSTRTLLKMVNNGETYDNDFVKLR